MAESAIKSDEKTAWTYAFLILLLVSAAMIVLRLAGKQFLVFEFEVALIYFPTALSGMIAAYVIMKG
jgi:hypothetical protein